MLDVVDRVPTYEGRIELIPVPGSSTLFDMSRADEATVGGTPINKALFDSIKADLDMIAPPIEPTADNIADSRNVACYASLAATGLLEASTTTDNFVAIALPVHSAVICGVNSDTVTLSDLPSQTGALLLMKGATAAVVAGWFIDTTDGSVYRYVYSTTQTTVRDWTQLVTKAYVDELVGDINTALDTISGEVI